MSLLSLIGHAHTIPADVVEVPVLFELDKEVGTHTSPGRCRTGLIFFELVKGRNGTSPCSSRTGLVLFEFDEDVLAHVPVDVAQVIVEALLLHEQAVQAASKELPSEKKDFC
jgi:hypothetical protein